MYPRFILFSQWYVSIVHRRYLWPLIHYHKFLAKCVKKLKRNGVDVKSAVTPVAIFLRQEVCAVSEHLAKVSLYGSEEWMSMLQHFDGWSDNNKAEEIRSYIATLKLRPINEPGDVDSPLLRSQIDKQLLKAMATARAQLLQEQQDANAANKQRNKPPVHPNGKSPHGMHVPGSQNNSRKSKSSRNGSHGHGSYNGWYPPAPAQGWWGWPPRDDNSVHSALSDSVDYSSSMYHGHPPPPMHPAYYGHHPHHHPMYPPPGMGMHPYDYAPTHMMDPSAYYGAPPPPPAPPATVMESLVQAAPIEHQQASPSAPEANWNESESSDSNEAVPPATPSQQLVSGLPEATGETPYHAQSPYWRHLDQATYAVMASPAATPARATTNTVVPTPQPLYSRSYYGYPQVGAEAGYPSPATQFLMSPTQQWGYGSPQKTSAAVASAATPTAKPATESTAL